ncbi:SagB family peptide dehydrogenase [Actinokineospora cianjurensis]|uniref:SagB-type dehydrogenase family enzyme n=1 Tax=Actinokineospora cianjurensis TaxID=585224 RepID=A0A421B515_9PSEU|nr:SagB family peptide dehydrogenase [Actinokineospora cianjurensis]RLK59481.1 SagB-type dehydrogenase family enzyme [Actinokineospora cianjurensis]
MRSSPVNVATTSEYTEMFQLRPGVFSARSATEEVHLVRWQLWQHDESFGKLSEDQARALERLAAGPCSAMDLSQGVDEPAPLVRALRAGGWLTTIVYEGDRALYTVLPLDPPPAETVTSECELVLSRFAVMRREGDGLVVESPVAWAQMHIHDPQLAAILMGADGGSASGVRTRFEKDLRLSGLLVPAGSEETNPASSQWRSHELWFHQRSRRGNGGYFGAGYGRTQWAHGAMDLLPARRTSFSAPAIELYRPELAALRLEDTTLTTAVEERRSVRVHDDTSPMTADQLGEFLFRCARVRGTFVADGIEYASRPLPSGGGVAELELYPVVRQVEGLAPGMYHYDSHAHQLRMARGPGHEVTRLLRTAAHTAVVQTRPQVLIVISARFGRLMRTYEEMPYSIVLKHVGVLYQTMYLVATAMGLAPCGLGGGDAAAFTAAIGADPLMEASVGEFMLGSRPPGDEYRDTSAHEPAE